MINMFINNINLLLHRWLLFPLLFSLLSWLIFLFPNYFINNFPIELISKKKKDSHKNYLIKFPKTIKQSWNLSKLHYQLLILEEDDLLKNKEKTNNILKEASDILKLKTLITSKELHEIENEIKIRDSKLSFSQKLYNIFTFVNLIWFIAIIGLAVSVGPFCYHALKPIRTWVIQMLVKYVHLFVEKLYKFLSEYRI